MDVNMSMDVSSSDSESYEETEKMDTPPIKCLFCDARLTSSEDVWKHCKKEHAFDLQKLEVISDQIDYIKMINFIRQKPLQSSEFELLLMNHVNGFPWNDERFLMPHDHSDGMLTFDFDANFGRGDSVVERRSQCKSLEEAEIVIAEQDAMLRNLEALLESSKVKLRELVSSTEVKSSCSNGVNPSPSTEDESYYESYAHFAIHEEMVKDRTRTESYQRAILENRALFEGKVVLDIGCGTGILSLFAAKAGAKKVIAVDFSEIAYQAMDIVRENNLQEIIEVKHSKVEDLDLDFNVDIIISEWMGYFLIFERMLESVLYAAKRFLRPNGLVLPDKFQLFLGAIGDESMYHEYVGFWKDVYGFKMSCLASEVVKEASIVQLKEESVLTDCCPILKLDLNKFEEEDLSMASEFTQDWSLNVKSGMETSNAKVFGFFGYFDVAFDKGCEQKISFSTGTKVPSTHWKQTVFLLPEPEQPDGCVLNGKIAVRKSPNQLHSLMVHILFRDKKYSYYLH